MQEIVERVREISRENERLFEQLLAGERRFRGLAKAVWKVQEEERRRVARELHDGVGQTLTALALELERTRQKLAREGAPELAGKVGEGVELARQALDEVRELSRLLRPPVLDDLGLPAALSWLARSLEQRTGLAVDLALDGLDGDLDPDLATLIFRLVQEALTNVLRHAEVGRAEVAVRRTPRALELRVADRGRGFDAAAALDEGEADGSGLRGMRDRLELFGGHLTLASSPGRGTTVAATVPLAP
jgi:two-component system sensor histidine kinase UhpB